MNSEKLQQLQAEIQQEMIASLDSAKFAAILEKYAVSGNGVLKFKCVLDLAEMQVNDAEAFQFQELMQSVSETKIVLQDCSWCIPCPHNPILSGCFVC